MRTRRRTGLLAAEFQLLVSEATRSAAARRRRRADRGGEIVLHGRQVATRLWSDERDSGPQSPQGGPEAGG